MACAMILVLGQATAGERFPHGVHADAEIDCETCHEVAESQDLSVSLLPSPETCVVCHDPEALETRDLTEFDRATSEFDGFSHKTHGDTECSICHLAFAQPEEITAVSMAGHDACFRCHNGSTADDACESCHRGPLEGAPAGVWWGLALQESSHHGPGFLHRHQFEAMKDGGDCGSCHREEFLCSTCHHGENVEYAVHDRVWRFTHAQEAMKNLQDCQACHELDSFCTGCHAYEGIQPGNHTMAGWIFGQNLHAAAARRDIAGCAACHESDQVSCGVSTACHRDDNIQGNQQHQNIHPSGFQDDVDYGPWHEDESA